MIINYPFFILVFFALLTVITNIVNHGKERPFYDAYVSLIAVVLEMILIIWAISYGGILT